MTTPIEKKLKPAGTPSLARIFRSRHANTRWFSLTPCFSWVRRWHRRQNRFNGLQQSVETVETLPASFGAVFTQLKQGVNERTSTLGSKGHEVCELASCCCFALLFIAVQLL